jgi:hypothetical protein
MKLTTELSYGTPVFKDEAGKEVGRLRYRKDVETAELARSMVAAFNAADDSAEPLTTAYVAIGAETYWRSRGNLDRSAMAEEYGGQLGFIGAVIEHAVILDRMANGRELDAVFAYDIAEEFGARFARALFDGEDALFNTPRELAEGIAKSIFDAAE